VERAEPRAKMSQVAALFKPVPKQVKAKPGKQSANAKEKLWMTACTEFGCFACYLDGVPPRPSAIHHLLRGGRRIGHLFTLPLCDPGHHQNGGPLGLISRHPYKARFEAVYGTEDDMLRRLCHLLNFTYPG
jgi:hypothetical protein